MNYRTAQPIFTHSLSQVQGEVKLFDHTDGYAFEDYQVLSGSKFSLLDSSKSFHNDLTVRRCHFQGRLMGEDSAIHLRQLTGVATFEDLLITDQDNEHGIYLLESDADIHIRRVRMERLGSNGLQYRHNRPGPYGVGAEYLCEDVLALDCGLPRGRRVGFVFNKQDGEHAAIFHRCVTVNRNNPAGSIRGKWASGGGFTVRDAPYVELNRCVVDHKDPDKPAMEFVRDPELVIKGGYVAEGKISIMDCKSVRIPRIRGNAVIVVKEWDPNKGANGGWNKIATTPAEGGYSH